MNIQEPTCLLVNLRGGDLKETWHQRTEAHLFAATVAYTESAEEAEMILNSGSVLTMVVLADDASNALETSFKGFQNNVGCIAEFQAIVNSDPHPRLLAAAFEYGIEQFFREDNWVGMAAAMTRNALAVMEEEGSSTAKTVNLTMSIRSGDHAAIDDAKSAMGDLAEWDFRAAFATGKAAEASGHFTEAIKQYGAARGMNFLFKGAASSQSEAYLMNGETDEALKLLKELEAQNPYDMTRKGTLASTYLEKGDIAQAAKYVKDAGADGKNNSKVLEARAQVLLASGRVADAFKLIEQMTEVGPFFAAKLNELGIKLSKAGKSKSALAVYQKAHKVVKPELRHKISMNAALACRRLKAWDMAIKYVVRAEKEYGSKFEKGTKLKKSLLIQKKKAIIVRKKAKLAMAKRAKLETKKAG